MKGPILDEQLTKFTSLMSLSSFLAQSWLLRSHGQL
jgi:hypothetical protein